MGLAWLQLLVALGGFRGARALQEADVFTFRGGDIRDFTVAARWVYVVTGDHLYQLNLSLGLLHSLPQRGAYTKSVDPSITGRFDRALEGDTSNATFSVNTLAPIVDSNLLVTCGKLVCGFCEMLDLANITRILTAEDNEVSPVVPEGASVGFLVDVNRQSYILSAAEESKGPNDPGCPDSPEKSRIRLHNTHESQDGGLLSFVDGRGDPEIVARRAGVEFVDGFQIKSTIFLFSNVKGEDSAPKVRLLWFETKASKTETLKSLRGATLDCCEGGEARQRLVSSSVIPGDQPVLWTGIFTDHDVTNTELAIFDISPPTNERPYRDPHFSYRGEPPAGDEPIRLEPIRVLLKHRFMTSVLAVKLNNWLIFIGTGDGELLKLTVDGRLQAQCLSVIWKAPDDRRVFPKMHLDPVGRKHVFVAVRNELMRVPVSQCGKHGSLESCWNARDPYCGWCEALGGCSFEDECPSSLWMSVPDDLSQRRMLSHSFQEDGDGKIRLVVFTHLKRGGSGAHANHSCRFVSSVGELGELQHQYPQCTCLLPPVIGLHVSVTVSLGEVDVTEELNLLNCSGITGAPTSLLCSQCLAAGCGWSNGACTWTHTERTVCQALQTGVDSLPEIFSITPSELSFYGKNHALLSGRNLGDVIGVRLQGDLDCSPKEASVWLNTGTNLTFHIPAGDKGRVRVCLLLPDGSCHGNTLLIYRSAPVCTSIAPDSTWVSGKRRMNITVSNPGFVDEVIHSHTDQKVPFSKTDDGVSLQFESLATQRGPFSSSVSLRVANHMLACPTAIRYLPDPQFTTFYSTPAPDHLLLTIEKRADELEMAAVDVRVRGVQGSEERNCVISSINHSKGTDYITCVIQSSSDTEITAVKIMYGDQIVLLKPPWSYTGQFFLRLINVMLVGLSVGGCIYCYLRQRRLTAQMNNSTEDLEMDIRNDFRQDGRCYVSSKRHD